MCVSVSFVTSFNVSLSRYLFNQQLNAYVSLWNICNISSPHLTTKQYICENVLNVM